MHIAIIIFVLTYVLIALQNIPKVHISRPAGALLGAVGMVVFGVLSLDEAWAAIEFNTILFLLGMMIIGAYLEISGFFELTENYILKKAANRVDLLFLLIFSSGLFSSLFMNDTICLIFTPIVLRVARRTGLRPTPYLIALATSSNIGSAMSIIGNPQNMLIGLKSGIPFIQFLRILAPVSLGGLYLNFLIIRWVYKHEISNEPLPRMEQRSPLKIQKGLLWTSMTAMGLLLVLLSFGAPPQGAAMVLACLLIVAGSAKPRRALEEVDWTLLLLFSGLFVVMKGIEKVGITDVFLAHAKGMFDLNAFSDMVGISTVSAVTSNVISNVPAVILISNIVEHAVVPDTFWLILAMSSTLAGNLTIIGSIANIIVFETARDDVKVGFGEYFRVGLPLTLISIVWGIVILLYWK